CNGYADQHVAHPISVTVGRADPRLRGERRARRLVALPRRQRRLQVADANANPANELVGLQSLTIGPGDGTRVELVLKEAGTYPAVNHASGRAQPGAIALLQASQAGERRGRPFDTELSRRAPGSWRPRNVRGGTIGGTEGRPP